MKRTYSTLTVVAALAVLLFAGSLSAGELDGDDSFGGDGVTALDLKGGFMFGSSDDAIGFENRVGPQFGLGFLSPISPWIAWGLQLDYGYSVTTIGTGNTTTLANSTQKVTEEVDVTGHSFDAGGQLGLTIPLGPLHIFAMVGPAFSYFTIQHNEITFSDGTTVAKADENFMGVTMLARAGAGFHFDEKTGIVGEIGIRLGSLTSADRNNLKSPHDGYSIRAGFRFLF